MSAYSAFLELDPSSPANILQVAYFAAIPKADLAKSEVIVAGLFFRNVFGNSAGARCLPAFVALSNLGNVLAVSFAHARVNQGMRGNLFQGTLLDDLNSNRICKGRVTTSKSFLGLKQTFQCPSHSGKPPALSWSIGQARQGTKTDCFESYCCTGLSR